MGAQPSSSRTVWARIKEALHDRGLPETQVYAARLIGVEQPSVSDWNKPGMYPTLDNAVTLAKKLGVCVGWLLTERGPKHPGPPGDDLAQELWALWEHLSPRVRRDLVGAANIAAAEATGVFPKSIVAPPREGGVSVSASGVRPGSHRRREP